MKAKCVGEVGRGERSQSWCPGCLGCAVFRQTHSDTRLCPPHSAQLLTSAARDCVCDFVCVCVCVCVRVQWGYGPVCVRVQWGYGPVCVCVFSGGMGMCVCARSGEHTSELQS